MRFFAKLLTLILTFILGFVTCVATIAGAGYLAYNHLSINFLNKLGVKINTEPYFEEDALVPVNSLTVKEMVAEFQRLRALGDEVTFNALQHRYGLKLSDEISALFPEGVRELPFTTIFGKNGLHAILDTVEVAYVLRLVPKDLFSDPMVHTLENKTLADVVDMDLGYLFEDVDLGYLLGVQYAKNNAGEYELVPADPDKKTLKELIAPIKLGTVLSDAQAGKLDVLEVIDSNLADVTITALTDSLESVKIPTAFGPKTLGEIIEMGDDGKYAVNVEKLTEDVLVGELMGYSLDENDGHWYENNGADGEERKRADAMVEPICGTLLIDLLRPEEGKTVADAIMGSYRDSDTKLGDIMGYVLDAGVWYVDDGKTGDERTEVEAFFAPICNVNLADIIDSSPEKTASDAIMEQFEICGTKLGDMMGYVYDDTDKKWYLDDGTEGEDRTAADSFIAPLCDVMLYELIDHPENKPAEDVIKDKFKESDTRLGDLMGYEKVPNPEYDELAGNSPYIWYDDSKEITGVGATIADYTLDQILDGGIDTDDITEKLTISEVYGLTASEGLPVYLEGSTVDISDEVELDIWYDENNQKSNSIISALAEYKVSELDDKLNELTIANVLDLVEYDGKYYSWEIVEDESGDYIVLTEDTSITAEFADLDLDSLSNGGIEAKIDEIHIGKFLGYTQNEDGEWENEDGVVDGILGIVAGATTETLEDKINKTTIGDIAGYTYVVDSEGNGAWYVEYESETDNVPATGLLATLADLTVPQLSNEEDLRLKVQNVHLYDVLGYTFDEEKGEYYKLVGEERVYAEGVMSSIMGSTVGNVEDDINETTIAKIAGYYYNEDDGKYYTDKDFNNEAHGVLVSLADLKIGALTDDGEVSRRIKNVTIADVFEYKQDPETEKWYSTNADGSLGEEVTGIMAAIAGSQISNISDDINGKEMGLLLGYTYGPKKDNVGNVVVGQYCWYDESGDEVHPLMNKVASTLFSDLGSITNELTVADMILPEDRESGYISLIDETTKLNELPEELNKIFAEKTIGELAVAGIIELDEGTTLNPYIAGLTINELINYSLSNN